MDTKHTKQHGRPAKDIYNEKEYTVCCITTNDTCKI